MSNSLNVAVVGAGTTSKIGTFAERSRASLTAEALRAALNDAGLKRDELDGFVTNYGSPYALDYDRLCETLGLDVEYASQKWTHGRFTGAALQEAVMAIESGLANYVVAGVGVKYSTSNQAGDLGGRETVSLQDAEHLERPWYGMSSPVASGAMATRYYMERYGATSEDLAHIAVTFRDHAAKNPRAHYSSSMTIGDHQDSRWLVEPLRLYDTAPYSDGGAFVVLTASDNADSVSGSVAEVTAMKGMPAGRDESQVWARPGIGIQSQAEYEYAPRRAEAFYAAADVSREEIDGLYTYDALTPNVWFALERWGHCAPGTAHEFTKDGNIGLGGTLPINTNGGLLSEGHLVGWGHLVEMYRQLAGEAE